MEFRKVSELLEMNYKALTSAKGHNKATIKTCIILLSELPQNIEIATRNNTATPTNAGDIAEVLAGVMLERKSDYMVSINGTNDLDTVRKNEVKLCYSNNRPSNDIEDKGHYMIDVLQGFARLTFISRSTVRACRHLMVNNKRGGKLYAEAVLNYQS